MENRSLVTIANHSREKIEYLIKMASAFEQNPNRRLLEGKVVATLFFEPSTRTRLSFETAANRLGARVIGFADPKVTSGTKGETLKGDTLHIFVVHAPSRFGGEKHSRPNRQLVADRVMGVVRQLSAEAKVIIVGDFNDGATDAALRFMENGGMHNVTAKATGAHGAKATYRYQGVWQSIDHVFVSAALLNFVEQTFINDAPFLLEEDKKYGGVKPLRTFNGYRYQRGFSDHLPLVVRFKN